MPVETSGNTVFITGNYTTEDLYYVSSSLHRIADKQGYQDFTLDFSQCGQAYSAAMLPICAWCLHHWKRGIDVRLVLPEDRRLRALFSNTNWAYFIDHRSWPESRYRGITHSPALRFTSGAEQNATVNKAMDVLLAAIKHLSRDELRYLEWAITELTDNVMNHSESSCGGLLQITNHRARKEIEVVVSDAGLGIPTTLKPAFSPKFTDAELLQFAIQENVTRDKSVGQGNGLYGSWRLSQISGGSFSIFSNYGRLISPQPNELRAKNEKIPISGTTVQARLGYDREVDLSKVMVFPNRPFETVDYLETHFDQDEFGNVMFDLSQESDGFGSRTAARPVRRKLENLLEQLTAGKISIDLSEVKFVSSSYADELFGKLFVILGPISFMDRIQLISPDPLVKGLIDRAITQRAVQGLDSETAQ